MKINARPLIKDGMALTSKNIFQEWRTETVFINFDQTSWALTVPILLSKRYRVIC